jgi:hypothetical protein
MEILNASAAHQHSFIRVALHVNNRHRWTGRFEAHLWDKHCLAALHNKKKGRQGVCTSLQNSSTIVLLLEGAWKYCFLPDEKLLLFHLVY